VYRIVSSTFSSVCEKGGDYQTICQEKLKKIVLSYDPTSSIKSKLGRDAGKILPLYLLLFSHRLDYWSLSFDNDTLTVLSNLKTWDKEHYQGEYKLTPLLDVEISRRDLASEINGRQSQLQSIVGKLIPFEGFILSLFTKYLLTFLSCLG